MYRKRSSIFSNDHEMPSIPPVCSPLPIRNPIIFENIAQKLNVFDNDIQETIHHHHQKANMLLYKRIQKIVPNDLNGNPLVSRILTVSTTSQDDILDQTLFTQSRYNIHPPPIRASNPHINDKEFIKCDFEGRIKMYCYPNSIYTKQTQNIENQISHSISVTILAINEQEV